MTPVSSYFPRTLDLEAEALPLGRIAILVGEPEATARMWAAWGAARGKRVVACSEPSDRATLLRSWVALALEGKDVVATIAEALAARTGASAAALAYRLRSERNGGAADPLDALADSPFLHAAYEALLDAALAGRDLWPALLIAVERLGGDLAWGPRALGELVGWERAPAIGFACGDDSLPAAAEFAAQLADRSPRLSIAIQTGAAAWTSYTSGGAESHAKGLLRDGVIWFASNGATADSERDEARTEARAALEAARARGGDAAADRRLRSAAEALLCRALEGNAYTRGRYVPNQTIDVVFGTRLLEVDLLGTACGIAIEIDGYYHFRDAAAYRRDRRKDVLMQQAGYLVVRVLAEDVIDSVEAVLSRIVALTLDYRPSNDEATR